MELQLPDDFVDQTVNKAELAEAFGVSEPTIGKWLTKGLPYEVEGTNGSAYQFSLRACFAWKLQRDVIDRQESEARRRSIDQMHMLFLNEDGEAYDPGAAMTPDQIRKASEAEMARMKADEMRGDLVRASRVTEAFEDVINAFRTALGTLPDYAERELGLPPDLVEKFEARCDQVLLETQTLIRRSRLDRRAAAPDDEDPGEQEAMAV